MAVAGCNKRTSPDHSIVILSLLHCYLAKTVQTPRKSSSKVLRHMLHDHNAGGVKGHGLKKNPESLGAASGSPDNNNFLCCLDHGLAGWLCNDRVSAEFR